MCGNKVEYGSSNTKFACCSLKWNAGIFREGKAIQHNFAFLLKTKEKNGEKDLRLNEKFAHSGSIFVSFRVDPFSEETFESIVLVGDKQRWIQPKLNCALSGAFEHGSE